MKKLHTRDIIAQTVLETLQKKNICEITVSEIVHEVGVSTRTFYNCFSDKFEVCNYIYDILLSSCCWTTNGRRSTLKEFFSNLMVAIAGDYSSFFRNTMCYTGQNNITEHIIERGVEDLKDQLRYTGHEALITSANVTLLQFYMRGLSSTLQFFISTTSNTEKEILLRHDKTSFLPQSMYDALTSALISSQEN